MTPPPHSEVFQKNIHFRGSSHPLGLSFIPALGKSIDPFDPCDLLEDKLQEFKKSGDIKVSVLSSSGHRESESVQTKPGVAFFQFRSSKKQKCEAKDCRFHLRSS